MLASKHKTFRSASLSILLFCLIGVSATWAGPREQAKRMHDRLVGVPPTGAVLDSMAASIQAGNAVAAAMEAMQNPAFYNTTVREFATPWSNREQSVYAPLNDSTATVIGMIRDDVPFDQVLYDDVVYVASPQLTEIPPYSHANNDQYVGLQQARVDLSDPGNLASEQQSALPGAPIGAADAAGLMTTRGFAEAFLVAGTNRAAVRFAMLNFMCMDMEDFRDPTAWPDRIRQDVSRSPGGDSSIFLNDCLVCHAGLDGLAGAFAFYDFDEDAQQLVHTPGSVQLKYLNDAGNFRFGYETVGDSWINYWRTGPNSWVGWGGPGSGMGAKSFGMEIAQTRQFAECQVKQVFRKVCHRTPNGSADLQTVQTIANSFEANGRSMKQVFAETAVSCMGD